jgi:phage/conjugal plasmid C-4 type zinc finger TraR family protein
MNPCDKAQEFELADWERNQRAAVHPAEAVPSAFFCEDCDDEIPPARREAQPGCTRCAECQGIFELRQKQQGIRYARPA